MLQLKLVPTPTDTAPVHTPSGRGPVRLQRASTLSQPRKLLTLRAGEFVEPGPNLSDYNPFIVVF